MFIERTGTACVAPVGGPTQPVMSARTTHAFNWDVPRRVWEHARMLSVWSRRTRRAPVLTLSVQAERGITLLHLRLTAPQPEVPPKPELGADRHSFNAEIPWPLYEEMTLVKLRHGLDYYAQLTHGLRLLHDQPDLKQGQ